MQRSTLAEVLRLDHEAAIVHQAELIRQWPVGLERTEQAEIHVRSALWERTMGRINEVTQYRIYSILSFVMPDDAAFADERTPMGELERQAEYETAYYEQLERQTCPECGEGICPVENDLGQTINLINPVPPNGKGR